MEQEDMREEDGKESAAFQRLIVRRRGFPFTAEEFAARQQFDSNTQYGLAVLEGERGRPLREDEFPEALKLLQKLREENEAEEREQERRDAEEEAARARAEAEMEREMSTSPAAARHCRTVLKEGCRIEGACGESLLLPAGPADLCFSFVMKEGADREGVPLIDVTVDAGASGHITRRLNLVEIIDLTALKSAEWWRELSAERQDAFRTGVLLNAAECCEYAKEWVQFKIGRRRFGFRRKFAFYCRDTAFKAVLSIPAGSDTIWCRVHGLSWIDPEKGDDWVEVPPFCFPLSMKRLLSLRHIPDDGDSSF